ncbi:MAG TPA: hypothetical protein VE548_11560 [Nitrososphaeraceae archaeon]|jgi:hypothetical protein|nr:hypothetical protein [Nitrososphaeraceae archaeon]
MRVQNMILLALTLIFATVLTGIVSADSPNIYCYDEDMEGYICFETQKDCEIERENDVLADSKCYKSTE